MSKAHPSNAFYVINDAVGEAGRGRDHQHSVARDGSGHRCCCHPEVLPHRHLHTPLMLSSYRTCIQHHAMSAMVYNKTLAHAPSQTATCVITRHCLFQSMLGERFIPQQCAACWCTLMACLCEAMGGAL